MYDATDTTKATQLVYATLPYLLEASNKRIREEVSRIAYIGAGFWVQTKDRNPFSLLAFSICTSFCNVMRDVATNCWGFAVPRSAAGHRPVPSPETQPTAKGTE